jgi:hypothetical protein
MGRKTKNRKIRRPKTRLGLPDLDQSKAAVIGSLRSPESQRGYRHAILTDHMSDSAIAWPLLCHRRTTGYASHNTSEAIKFVAKVRNNSTQQRHQ